MYEDSEIPREIFPTLIFPILEAQKLILSVQKL